MSLFKSKKKFTVSERDPTYKVRYLGNVQTSMMRGDGCVDKPTAILWNNFMKTTNAGLDMKLTISASGLKAVTKEQGLTEYRAHRISYCIAHPKYPKVFIWVYRHEAKKLKVELRCHAVICKTEAKAKAMAVQLHDKLASALSEFMREKCRKQNTRLSLQRTNSLPSNPSGMNGLNVRNKFLSTGQNFKPPVDRSASAPKLGCITEDFEPEEVMEELEEEEDEELDDDFMLVMSTAARHRKKSAESDDITQIEVPVVVEDEPGKIVGNSLGGAAVTEALTESMFSLEVGNDVDALKKDSSVRYQLEHTDSEDNDDDSSESGFSEQDVRESSSNGSTFGSDPQLSNGSSSTGSHSSSSHTTAHGTTTTGTGCPQNNNHHQEHTGGPHTSTLEHSHQCSSDQCSSSLEKQTVKVKPSANISQPAVANINKRPTATADPAQMAAASAAEVVGSHGSVPNGRVSTGSAGDYNPNIMNERRL